MLVPLLWVGAFSLVSVRRPRLVAALASLAAIIGAIVAMVVAELYSLRLFDSDRELAAGRAFDYAVLVIALTLVVELLATPILYLVARRRAADQDGVPLPP
jgi:hypothetical protein